MPVHHTIVLGKVNLDQTASAGPSDTLTGLGLVAGTMGGTHQPPTGAVKKTVRLIIHFHGHMGAAVQIGMTLPLVANCKSAAGQTQVLDIKSHRQPTVSQVSRIANRDQLARGYVHSQASGMHSQPVMQFSHGMSHVARRQGMKSLRLVGAIANGDTGTARIEGHLQIVGGITDH